MREMKGRGLYDKHSGRRRLTSAGRGENGESCMQPSAGIHTCPTPPPHLCERHPSLLRQAEQEATCLLVADLRSSTHERKQGAVASANQYQPAPISQLQFASPSAVF